MAFEELITWSDGILKDNSLMAFEELITWSDQKVRPDWQKDALRRLATTGELSKEDFSDLRRVVEKAKPNHTKKAKQRIGELNEAKAKLYKDGYDPAVQEFRDPLTAIYTLMRETWERIVEEILFNGTIQRFRPEVMTQSLKLACYDPADDYPAIFEGMKRCSHHSGHDRAADLPQELPEKVDIDADLQALVEFHKKVSDRKAVLEKGHSYEKGPEPEFL